MATAKEIKVLKKIYELGGRTGSVHYLKLIDTIFDEDVRNRYRSIKIQRMACTYLGRMSHKDYINADYARTNAGYVYFVGYYLRDKGIEILKNVK